MGLEGDHVRCRDLVCSEGARLDRQSRSHGEARGQESARRRGSEGRLIGRDQGAKAGEASKGVPERVQLSRERTLTWLLVMLPSPSKGTLKSTLLRLDQRLTSESRESEGAS